ncbi:MAG: tRNA (guanosine(46)-N7)-methyltransferase TrmB [Mycoplasmatales bacterium]
MRLRHKPWAKDFIKDNPEIFVELELLEQLIPQNKEVCFEFGMGKGDFIIQMAKQNPEIMYFGFELQPSVIVIAGQKILKEKIPNLKLICANVFELGEYESVHEKINKIYLNFSDPWPKTRHTKKRLTSPEFLKVYQKLLKKNGELIQKTDNDGLFEYSIVSLVENNWSIADCCIDIHRENSGVELPITEFERRFMGMGKTIKFLKAKVKESNEN